MLISCIYFKLYELKYYITLKKNYKKQKIYSMAHQHSTWHAKQKVQRILFYHEYIISVDIILIKLYGPHVGLNHDKFMTHSGYIRLPPIFAIMYIVHPSRILQIFSLLKDKDV
jgi:hypothetical protein